MDRSSPAKMLEDDLRDPADPSLEVNVKRAGRPDVGEIPEPDLAKVPVYLKNFRDWIDTVTIRTGKDHKETCEEWMIMDKMLRTSWKEESMDGVAENVLELVSQTLSRVRALCEAPKGGKVKWENETSPVTVLGDALRCAGAASFAISCLWDDMDPSRQSALLDKLDPVWINLCNSGLMIFLRIDNQAKCGLLDLIASFQKEFFARLPDEWQMRVVVFLMGYAHDKDLPASVRSKIGRSLAKLVEFPSLREDVGFIFDAFQATKKGILNGEAAVKISYAWTFGNLTDALVDTHMNSALEKRSKTFLLDLLETALRSTSVPPRGRYSACRACSNMFIWLKPEMLKSPDCRYYVVNIVNQLSSMIGSGLDYKLRWNASRAVGPMLENEFYFTFLQSEVTLPVIKNLCKWVSQSQNFKERIQCLMSLRKVPQRQVYGNMYGQLWERLCLSLSKLPAEDSENIKKFKIEALLLIIHLIYVIELRDIAGPTGDLLATNHELLSNLSIESSPDIPLDQLVELVSARDNVQVLKEKAADFNLPMDALVEIMAQCSAGADLPTDTE